MTISSTNRKAGPYSGTGAQTAYPFAFKVFAAADLLVVQTDASGVESTRYLATHYTVALNANQDTSPGGTVTMLTPPPIGYLLTIGSAVPSTQGQSIPNQGGFYPKVVENALDRLTIVVQQALELLGRSLKFPFSDPPGGSTTLPGKAQRKGTVLAFDENTGAPVLGPRIAQIAVINAAYAAALAAIDDSAYLRTYMDQVVSNITFPLDLGLIADPVIYNRFDLGAL